jgi:hypothetical protein
LWHVIIEWTLEDLKELFRLMLSHVSVKDKDNETGVEELT